MVRRRPHLDDVLGQGGRLGGLDGERAEEKRESVSAALGDAVSPEVRESVSAAVGPLASDAVAGSGSAGAPEVSGDALGQGGGGVVPESRSDVATQPGTGEGLESGAALVTGPGSAAVRSSVTGQPPESASSGVRQSGASEVGGLAGAAVPKYLTYPVELSVGITAEMTNALEVWARAARRGRSRGAREERITKTSIIRAGLAVILELEVDLREIANEEVLERRIREAVARVGKGLA